MVQRLLRTPPSWLLVVGLCISQYSFAQPPKPHHRHATLDARIGVGVIDGQTFDVLAMYLGVSTFYFGLGFYEEAKSRKAPDSMPIEALELSGIRSRRLLQMPFVFGAEIFRRPGQWLDVRVDGQFKGGLELEFNHLRTDAGTRIPGSPETNYFLGVGLRSQLIHPLRRWLGKDPHLFSSAYIGVSGEVDLLFRQLEIEDGPGKAFVSALFFFVVGSKKLAFL